MNDTTFQGDGKVTYVPVVVNAKLSKPITNADRIRSMTDEELAELFANGNCGYCRIHDFCFGKGCAINCEDVWLDWLRKEATP